MAFTGQYVQEEVAVQRGKIECTEAGCGFAEAQAALAAVEWASGKGEAAEEHFEVAVQLNPRWDRMDYVRKSTRWPPALYAAMEKFLSITAGAS